MSVTVTCNPNPVGVDNNTTCTATVSDTGNGGQSTPHGSYYVERHANRPGTFSSNTCTLSAGTCSVTYSATVANPGTYALTASYGGDTLHVPATSAGYALSVLRPTTTSVSCSPNPDLVGTSSRAPSPPPKVAASSPACIPRARWSWSVTPSSGGTF